MVLPRATVAAFQAAVMTRTGGTLLARFCYRPLFAATACLVLASCRAESPAAPAVVLIADLPRSASGPREVALHALVTYFDARAGVLYLQDPSGAQAFEIEELDAPVVIGQRIALAST